MGSKIFCSIGLLCLVLSLKGQDNWEPQTNFTGYVNSVAEYTDCRDFKRDVAIGLSDIGLLGTYKPKKNLEFKATLVYSHYMFHVSQLIVEAYGSYTFSDQFKLGAGRFLTPLSPVNLYFFAPLNPSGVVPMLVSHHFMFPQNISGLKLSGNFPVSSGFSVDYAVSGGTYPYINHFESGILGLLSQEDSHPSFGFYDTENDKINNYLCGTGRLAVIIKDFLILGGNIFVADAQQVNQDSLGFHYYPSTKYTYGFDAHLTLSDIVKINAEYWGGSQKTTSETDIILGKHIENDYEGYYAEAIVDKEIFQPFLRYDFIKDVNVNGVDLPTSAATVGVAYRPVFEALIKLEYKRVFATKITDIGLQQFEDYDYNYMQLAFVLSF